MGVRGVAVGWGEAMGRGENNTACLFLGRQAAQVVSFDTCDV